MDPTSNSFSIFALGPHNGATEPSDSQPPAGSSASLAGSSATPAGNNAMPMDDVVDDDDALEDYISIGGSHGSDSDSDTEGRQPKPEIPGVTVRVTDELPKEVQFMELANEPKNPYNEKLHGLPLELIHRDYRGTDRPSFPKVKASSMPAEVHFLDRVNNGRPVRAGALYETKNDYFVSISFVCDTQMPSMSIKVHRPGKNENPVFYKIFANSLRLTPAKDGTPEIPALEIGLFDQYFASGKTPEDFNKKFARGSPELTKLAVKNDLLRIRVRLNRLNQPDPTGYRTRPIWTGLKASELARIRQLASNEESTKKMTEFERTIAFLDRSTDLSIFRRCQSDYSNIRKYFNCFLGAMLMSQKFKNFWFYQLQLGKLDPRQNQPDADIFDPKCRLDELAPPRWMVNNWRIFSVKDNQEDVVMGEGDRASAKKAAMRVECVQPLNWASFNHFEVYPSVQDCAFLIRLALAREQAEQKLLIARMQERAEKACLVRFETMPNGKGIYKAYISLPTLPKDTLAELIRPELDTRIKLNVHGKDNRILEGHVVESAQVEEAGIQKEHDFDFVVQAFSRRAQQFDFGKGTHEANIEFIDDHQSANRARNATEMLATAQIKRKEGVDIQAVIFRSPFVIPEAAQGALAQQLDPNRLENIKANLQGHWKLNEEQLAAVSLTFTTETGVAIIFGPPGTGKTFTVSAAVHEHARIGRKIVFSTASNKASDAALSSFRKNAPKDTGIRAVRFVGGYKTYQERKGRVTEEEGSEQVWDGLLSATIEAAHKANPDNLFHVRMDAAVRRWANDASHAMHSDAQSYLSKAVKYEKLKGKARSDCAKDLRVLDEWLMDHFLEKEVDIIFATCASACHPTIASRFKPDVAFIDEAGQATIPDMCMVLDPYRESIKAVVLSGDHNQLMPVVVAKTTNEGLNALETSLFEQLYNDKSQRFERVMLLQQYRSNSELMDWANKAFYGGKLITHPSAEHISPSGQAARDFFAKLGSAKQNPTSPRVAIDISGPGTFWRKFDNSTSYCNDAEAEMIVSLVRHLLSFQPDSTKPCAIEPRHIGIFTPYKGQQRLLRNKLLAGGPKTPEARIQVEGFLATTWGIQGSEVDIGIISFCCNDPKGAMERMKFVGTSNALNVQNTRSRQFQIAVGNFKGWCEALSNAESTIHNNRFKKFSSLVQHFYEKKDIVSALDMQDVISSGKPSWKAEISRFYTDITCITPKRRDARDLDLRKKGPKKQKTGTARTAGDIVEQIQQQAQTMALDPKQPSNRQLKRERRAREAADKKAALEAQKAADEKAMGMEGFNPQPKASIDDRMDWSMEAQKEADQKDQESQKADNEAGKNAKKNESKKNRRKKK